MWASALKWLSTQVSGLSAWARQTAMALSTMFLVSATRARANAIFEIGAVGVVPPALSTAHVRWEAKTRGSCFASSWATAGRGDKQTMRRGIAYASRFRRTPPILQRPRAALLFSLD